MSNHPEGPDEARPGWATLLSGRNFVHALILAGGVMLHAGTIFIVTTILPSVVGTIGGLDYYAWSTTLFVIASILGAALSGKLLGRAGAGNAYLVAAALFAAGGLVCAAAPSFPVLLAGRFVQGFGGGLFSALAYGVIRLILPEALWSRAISLISVTWGTATLIGPAVGGVFAEIGAWRAAFWTPSIPALLFGLLAVVILPKRGGVSPAAMPVPFAQLGLLVASVLAVSAGSVTSKVGWNVAGIGAAAALAVLLLVVEARSRARILPSPVLGRDGALAALYGLIPCLIMGMQADVFIPYFLQVLHGLSPLVAGYLAALMAAGWTLGSLVSGGRSGEAARRVLRAGPVFVLMGLAVLAVLVPTPGEVWRMPATGLGLVVVGLGIGVAWPHLVTGLFRRIPAAEQGLAASSITTVQHYATAFGAALAGMLANAGGLSDPGGVDGARGAALWLFAGLLAAPILGMAAAWRATRRGGEQGATEPATARRAHSPSSPLMRPGRSPA